MVDKKVEVKVATDVDMDRVEALEKKVNEMKLQRLQMKIDADTEALNQVSQKLQEAEAKVAKMNEQRARLKLTFEDEELTKAEQEVQALKESKIALEIAVETGKLEAAKGEVEELDGKEVEVDLQMSMQNFSQGISQAKSAVSELKQNMDEVAQAGMQTEQNKAFLTMNLGADKAKQTYQDISDIVASMPGDDNTMRSVLSTAQALGNNLNADEMKAAAGTMADYMSGSATMGKMALESQQDIMKYLLDGNTAELERGSIVSSQVDKLKEATTFQERQKAMQEVLNQLGYGGIAQQDTMLNKQAEWEGMIYNSQDALSSMWLGAEKGAMDYILKLNKSTDGLLGLGIVAAQMATGPVIELVGGLGQIGMGLKGLKEGIGILKELKIVTYAQAAASKIAAAAQWLWNFAVIENPIVLVIVLLAALAAAIIWAYYNVDWFREMVDNAFASLVNLANQIMSVVTPAIQWLANLFNQFTTQIGLNTNDWTQAILAFILFIPSLPMQVGIALANALASALGFKGNFVQSMVSAASSAISGFGNYLSQLSHIVMDEFNRVLGLVNDFINSLPSRVWDMGVAIIDALKKSLGIGSPGHMFYMMEGELKRIEDLPGDMETDITRNISTLGSSMVDSFNPNLQTMNAGVAGGSIGGTVININMSDFVVDNDDRVDRLCREIAKRINWNNETAGRTV